MAKKKDKKKTVKKVVLTDEEKEELKAEGELPKKSVRSREDKQLIWFFVIVGVIFASFLIPYFWVESSKVFEYGGADWVIEDYENLRIYHGRFASFTNVNLFYNVFLRTDPRENDVRTEGVFDDFKYGGVISMTPEVDSCRGELSRVMLDLGAFLRRGVGVGPLETGSTDEVIANESGRRYALCDNIDDRTIIIIDIGESAVIQDVDNPSCYKIYAESCNDLASVEKFMIKSIEDLFVER